MRVSLTTLRIKKFEINVLQKVASSPNFFKVHEKVRFEGDFCYGCENLSTS